MIELSVNKQLTLSIIIPAYNEEHYLRACLDSIAAQTDSPDEVLVVDNNSTDTTVAIAKEYSFVKVVREKQQSVLYARNRGFNTTRADIIGRIDADTRLDTGWVARARELFRDSTVMAATGPMFFYDMPFSPGNIAVDHMFKGPLYRYDKRFSFLAGTNMVIRRSAWLAVRDEVCMDKDVHEDLDLAIHLRQKDLKISYDTQLRAGMSSRRYDDSPAQMRRYTSMTRRVFKRHGIRTVGVYVSEVAYTLGYIILWPLRRSYNPRTGRRSMRQFVHGNTPRKNPMD